MTALTMTLNLILTLIDVSLLILIASILFQISPVGSSNIYSLASVRDDSNVDRSDLDLDLDHNLNAGGSGLTSASEAAWR